MTKRREKQLEQEIAMLKQAREVDLKRLIRVRRRAQLVARVTEELIETIDTPSPRQRRLIEGIRNARTRRRR